MFSLQGVGIEQFHCIQRSLILGGVGIEGFQYTEVSSFQGVGIEGFHCIQRYVCSFQGVGIEGFHCIQRYVCSFQGVGIEGFHCIQRYVCSFQGVGHYHSLAISVIVINNSFVFKAQDIWQFNIQLST